MLACGIALIRDSEWNIFRSYNFILKQAGCLRVIVPQFIVGGTMWSKNPLKELNNLLIMFRLGMDELPDSDEEDDEFSPSESDSKAAPSSSTSTSTDASFSSTRVEPSRSPQSPEDRHMDMETETETFKTAMPTSDADTEVQEKTATQTLETDTEMQAVTNMQALETDVENSDHRRDRTAAEENDTSLKTSRQGVEDTGNTSLGSCQVTEEQSLEKVQL